MTTTPSEDIAPGSAGSELRLGREVVRRMRLPGPPVGRPLPSRIGSLASSVSRFAAATSRPVEIRRALVGPDPRGLDASSAPPRWWTPSHRDAPVASAAASPASSPASASPSWLAPARPVAIRRLPERGLPRAARAVQDESTYTPGGILGNLRGEAIRVRRIEEVTAVGPMLMNSDRTKLNAGLAARARQSASSTPVTSTPAAPTPATSSPATATPVVRRSANRAPRQPATPTAPGPASEPPTATDPAPPAPRGPSSGEQATVRRTQSVGGSPPTGVTAPPSPTGGGSSTVPGTDSVDSPPPTGIAAPPAPPSGGSSTLLGSTTVDSPPPTGDGAPSAPTLRRATRPSWQLRSPGSRFDGLVRRTPAGHAPAPSAAAAPGLSTIVSSLASADRAPLSSGLRDTADVTAAGPRLISAGADAPATVRRHAWSAGSIVMRQAAGARAQVAAAQPAPSTQSAQSAPSTQPSRSTQPAPSAAAPSPTLGAPVTRAADPVVRRLPAATAAAPLTSASPAPASATETTEATETTDTGSTPTTRAPADVPEAPDDAVVRRLPRLWRRATDIRPATDVRGSTPAPAVHVASAPGIPAATTTTATTTTTAIPAPATVRRSAATTAAPAPAASASTSAPSASAPAAPTPITRVGAHVASPGVARAEVAMPELMTIRRATAHGTDSTRALATGFGAPETIRPASAVATALSSAPGRAPAGFGETRLWRRPAPAGGTSGTSSATAPAASAVRRSFGTPAATPTRAHAAGRAGSPPLPGAPARPAWQPWTETPATAPAPATAAFPAGPPGAASAPSGRRPAADVRRLTVAPPRISIAPQQPPAPPVPDVARGPASGDAASTTVRRSTGQSLIDATAHLFATPGSATPGSATPGSAPPGSATPERPPIRRSLEGDTAMAIPPPPPAPSSLPVPASSYEVAYNDGDLGDVAGPADQVLPGVGFNQVVDAVVERIERRVIDELERRGRWNGWRTP